MKRTLLLAILFVFAISGSFAKEYKISSPDNKILLTVNVGTDIKWYATREGKEILSNSKIALILKNGRTLGENEKVRKAIVSKLNEIIRPVVANKKIRDHR